MLASIRRTNHGRNFLGKGITTQDFMQRTLAMNTVNLNLLRCLPDARRRGAGKRLAAMLPLTCFTSENCGKRDLFPSMADSLIPPGRLLPLIPRLFMRRDRHCRCLAPLVNDKFLIRRWSSLMNVVSMSLACFQGHAGGANRGALHGRMLGADPVITTATDVNEMSALDTLTFQLNARMTVFARR